MQDEITIERVKWMNSRNMYVSREKCLVCGKELGFSFNIIYKPGIGINGYWFHQRCYDKEIAGI